VYIYVCVIQGVFEFKRSAFSVTEWRIFPMFLSQVLPGIAMYECVLTNGNMFEKDLVRTRGQYKGGVRVWMYVQWSCLVLQNELLLAFELKRILKIVPVGLMLDLVPKTDPRIIAAIDRIVIPQIGMANLFLRYHGRLLNAMKSLIKNTVRKR
jgi:hypothetical protein